MPATLYDAGDVIRFSYYGANTTDHHKEVLVLHPNWEGHTHAIDLKKLHAAEREVVRAIMDPRNKGKRHRIPYVNAILMRMDPWEVVRYPQAFYNNFVKVFLRNKDAYRRYFPSKMSGVQVVTDLDKMVKLTSAQQDLPPPFLGTPYTGKSLFKKEPSQPGTPLFKKTQGERILRPEPLFKKK